MVCLFQAHNLEKPLLFYFTANSKRSLNYKNHSGGEAQQRRNHQLRRDYMNVRLRHKCPQDAWSFTRCWHLPITAAHIPLVFLRVISQGLSVFQEGFGRWEESATGQPARWWVQCSETPQSAPFNSELQMCGLRWSGATEWRIWTLNAAGVSRDRQHHHNKYEGFSLSLHAAAKLDGVRRAGGIFRTFHCKVFLTHFQRWDCSGLGHMAFCWWLQNSVTHWWRLDIFV